MITIPITINIFIMIIIISKVVVVVEVVSSLLEPQKCSQVRDWATVAYAKGTQQ